MCKLFIRRFVASVLVLLIASSVLVTNGQSQSGILSDENEAEILESLIQSEIKPPGSVSGNIRIFSSENIGALSAARIAKHGFSLMAALEIDRLKQEYVVDYVVHLNLVRILKLIAVRVENPHVLIRIPVELFTNPRQSVTRFDRISFAAALASASSCTNCPT